LAPIDGDADGKLALLGFRAFRFAHRCGAAVRHEFLRRETNVGVGNFDRALAAESPLEGVHEDGVRLRMNAIPLREHVEVKSLDVATVAHFRFPIFIRTVFGSGCCRALHADFPLCGFEEVGGWIKLVHRWSESAADGGLGTDGRKAELVVYELETTSGAKDTMDF